MLLSEMLGVERDVDFMVEVVKGGTPVRYRIRQDYEGVEYLERYSQEDGWQVARENKIFKIIHLAPSGIIHLPPPLTDEQRGVLMSLFTIGARYMGMSRDGWKRCFVNKPQKEFSGWTCGDAQMLTIANGMANCLDSLASWSDHESYDIGKALGVEE